MKVLRIVPREVFVEFEISFQDLLLLKEGLEATELNLDTTTKSGEKVDTYFKQRLYPMIKELVENLENGA